MAELLILPVYLLILGVGGLIADYVFPHIPPLERFIESLPLMVDDLEGGEDDGPV